MCRGKLTGATSSPAIRHAVATGAQPAACPPEESDGSPIDQSRGPRGSAKRFASLVNIAPERSARRSRPGDRPPRCSAISMQRPLLPSA